MAAGLLRRLADTDTRIVYVITQPDIQRDIFAEVGSTVPNEALCYRSLCRLTHAEREHIDTNSMLVVRPGNGFTAVPTTLGARA